MKYFRVQVYNQTQLASNQFKGSVYESHCICLNTFKRSPKNVDYNSIPYSRATQNQANMRY